MATTSKSVGANGFYGHSGNADYTSGGSNHLYVGKSDSNNYFRSRLRFSPLSSLGEIGTTQIEISKIELYIRRNDAEGGEVSINVSCSSGLEWGATADNTVENGKITTETNAYQVIDLTNLKDEIQGYTSRWYLHISGSSSRTRFDGTSKTKKPYLMITWTPAETSADISVQTNKDTVVLGDANNPVNFTITSTSTESEKYTLSYALGDVSGVVATKTENKEISWTPPLSLATQITDDVMANVEMHLDVYDEAEKKINTVTFYQTVEVPDGAAPELTMGAMWQNLYWHEAQYFVLTGYSYMELTPVIDMSKTYGATIASLTAETLDGQIIQWTTLNETSPGVFTGNTAQVNINSLGDGKITMTVVDSRGQEKSSYISYSADVAYTPPKITNFNVERCEPVYNEDEEITGIVISDTGTMLCVSLSATTSSFSVSLTDGTTKTVNDQGSVDWEIAGENDNNLTLRVTSIMKPNITLPINNSYEVFLINNNYITASASETWTFTATVTDEIGGTAVQYDVVPPGHASFSISADKYGVAVGKVASGRESDPKFEVAESYTTYFGGDVYDKYNNLILGSSIIKNIDLAANDDIKKYTSDVSKNTDLASYNDSASGVGVYIVSVAVRWNKSSSSTYSGKEINTSIRVLDYNTGSAVATYYLDHDVMSSNSIRPAFCGTIVIPLGNKQTMRLALTQHTGEELTL